MLSKKEIRKWLLEHCINHLLNICNINGAEKGYDE